MLPLNLILKNLLIWEKYIPSTDTTDDVNYGVSLFNKIQMFKIFFSNSAFVKIVEKDWDSYERALLENREVKLLKQSNEQSYAPGGIDVPNGK